MQNTQPGRLFVFDGPDYSGKTTQIGRLQAVLEKRGYTVYSTRSHGGTPIGEELRKVSFMDIERVPLVDMHISLAMHAQLQIEMDAHRAKGDIVLLDRGTFANWAYQVYGGGLSAEIAAPLLDADMARINPDIVIYYAATLPELQKRMQANPHKSDYFEKQPADFFERVIAGYEYAAKRYGATTINAEQSIDAVEQQTFAVIAPLLPETK